MKSKFYKQQLEFFTFSSSDFSAFKVFDNNSYILAAALSFGFLLLVLITYFWKRQRYINKGYLKTEKNELKYLLEDMYDRSERYYKKGKANRRLLSLLTEESDVGELRITIDSKGKSSNNSLNRQKDLQQKIAAEQFSPSKIQNFLNFKGDHSITLDGGHKESMNQNDDKKDKPIEIIFENKNDQQKSRSSIFNQLSEVTTAVASPKPTSEKQNMLNQENNFDYNGNLDQNPVMSKNGSMVNSYTQIVPRSHRFGSNADQTVITPNSANCSVLTPAQQNQKLIESFSSIVVIQDKKSMNSNRSDKNSQQKEEYQFSVNEKQVQQQQKSLMEYLQKSNETNLLPIQKIKSPNNQKGDNQAKKKEIEMRNSSKDMDEEDPHHNNVDLSFNRVLKFSESTFFNRFSKNWKRLFVRHCILFNTLKEDTLLFPRVLKVLIISIFVNLKFFAGSFIQIYLYNQQIERFQLKYYHRIDHAMYYEKLLPSEDFYKMAVEISLNLVAAIVLTGLVVVFAFVSKADTDFLFFNINNKQLLNNLKFIQDQQSYKIFIGLFISFAIGAVSFLQYASVFQQIPYEFVERWFTIDILIIIFFFSIFDFMYITIVALIKAGAKKSARCHRLYKFILKKVSWWSI